MKNSSLTSSASRWTAVQVETCCAEELKHPKWSGSLGSIVMSGGEGQIGFVEIDKLEVGDTASATDLVSCKLDLSRMQPPGFSMKGLLGLNFLKSYRMTIDFERNSLRLEKGAGDQTQKAQNQ